MDHTQGRTIFFVYLDEKLGTNVAVTTPGVRRFPRTVSAVGHVCIMIRFVGCAAFFRPPNSVRRPREKLKTSGTQGRRDIVCVCIKSEFGRVMRPDIVVQMRDSS